MTMRFCLGVLLAAGFVSAQDDPMAEQRSLQQAVAEAGNSSVDLVRALENHLRRYPNAPGKADLERALLKAAIDLKDDQRTILYGEPVLSRDPDNIQILQYLSTALVRQGDQADAEKALDHAKHLEQVLQASFKNRPPQAGAAEFQRRDEYERSLASALLLQARAHGLLGQTEEAIQLAEASYKDFPSVEAAREAARWLSSGGKDREAIQYLADAFSIASFHSADPDPSNDRERMSELYRKLNGTEAGLGDLILKAYDDTSNLLAARRAQLRGGDPNAQAKSPMQFTLTSVEGDHLSLASLMGKVIVLDFWATWCIPCRAQHPLYDQVKAKFKDSDDVVFLSIDADQDKAVVKPFMESQNWTQKSYYEDGLANLLQVADIPTTIVFGKKGEVTSRMTGFIPERFVDMLTDRIDEALGRPPSAHPPMPVSGPLQAPIRQ